MERRKIAPRRGETLLPRLQQLHETVHLQSLTSWKTTTRGAKRLASSQNPLQSLFVWVNRLELSCKKTLTIYVSNIYSVAFIFFGFFFFKKKGTILVVRICFSLFFFWCLFFFCFALLCSFDLVWLVFLFILIFFFCFIRLCLTTYFPPDFSLALIGWKRKWFKIYVLKTKRSNQSNQNVQEKKKK